MSFYPDVDSCQIANLTKIYERYFGQKTDGLFVDVGAYNAIDFSNTWQLAEVGWTGICFEPVPEHMTACMKNHADHEHKVTTILSAVGSVEGLVNLYMGGVDSTIDKETLEKSPFGFTYDPENYMVACITTLNLSLPRFGVRPGFDVISIDTEGAELQVLDGFDLDFWHPRLMIVETHVGVPGRDYHAKEIIERILSHGYTIADGSDALNTLFWKD
jgi:FkbM family methyltransferase